MPIAQCLGLHLHAQSSNVLSQFLEVHLSFMVGASRARAGWAVTRGIVRKRSEGKFGGSAEVQNAETLPGKIVEA